MNFPDVFNSHSLRRSAVLHPAFANTSRVTDVIIEKDVLLNFPYHSFNSVIDLLREAAIDPHVYVIKITLYRLASNSKIINALINAVRNGKEVIVMLELRARFDEEANLMWKERLEEEGVKVLIGVDNMKVHAKVCIIKKRVANEVIQYGFVSTGNLNEQTAKVYGDHCLLTSNKQVMTDISRIFNFLESPKSGLEPLKLCQTLLVCPTTMRHELTALINREIKNAKAKREASIILKLNSLSDADLIEKLYEAAESGVEVRIIVRGIFCAVVENSKFKKPITAISVVDEYLEHARVMIFHNDGKEKVYISSADWMVRNLDHRIEVAIHVTNKDIIAELKDIISIQLQDNVKARWLDKNLSNIYVATDHHHPVRSQIEIYNYLQEKALQVKGHIAEANPVIV